MSNDYDIVRVMEHFEIYINGKFYCSADNKREAEMEIDDYERQCMAYNN